MLFCDELTPLGVTLLVIKCYLGYRVFRTLFAFIRSVLIYLIIPIFRKPNLDRFKQRWTVVSGGTDGIGKAYTFELAERGLRKFFLIGRNQTKLDEVKAELEKTYAAKVQTYLFDFFDGDYTALRDGLANLDIGFVVNSVGVGRDYLERYGDNPPADQQLLKVNALGSAEFMSCVLTPMEVHGGGQIVVLSSSQGLRPIPLLAAYSAAKALLCFISECIDREYKTIRVQCLTPALIATKMTFYEHGSLFVATPQGFARQAVNSLGLTTTTTGCFNHEIQMLLNHAFPWDILKYLMLPIYWKHQKRCINYHNSKKEATFSGNIGVEPKVTTTENELMRQTA